VARAEAGRNRVFQEAFYKADDQGVLRPELPTRCAFAQGAEPCHLFIDHVRPRKTGPRFPLAVVGCRDHPQGRYTLYPPGHFPYGREAVVSCSRSGELRLDVSTGEPMWEATLFRAAQDAAEGKWWPADSPWDDSRRRRTQGRWLDFAGRLLGVHPRQDEGTRERIALRLALPLVQLLDHARRWGVDWRTRGAVILAVLQRIEPRGFLLDRLLAAGAVADLWPEPRRAVRKIALCSSAPERTSHTVPRSRGPPPTTLQPASVNSGT
jgi:hypothetical protein